MARINPVHFHMTTTLSIDALYFHAALEAHEAALTDNKQVEAARERWTSIDERWKQIEREVDDPNAKIDLLHSLSRQFEDADYEVGRAYGIMIEQIAIVQVLSAATLESHINLFAKDHLGSKEFAYFERLSLEAKWLFLPRMLLTPTFQVDREPFQSFSHLVKVRDKLLHFKGLKEDWVSGEPPNFLLQIGLTLAQSQEAIKTVTGMITSLALANKQEPPYWLDASIDQRNYFDVSVATESVPREPESN